MGYQELPAGFLSLLPDSAQLEGSLRPSSEVGYMKEVEGQGDHTRSFWGSESVLG